MSTTNIVVGLQAQNTIKLAAYGTAEESATALGLVKGGISIEHDSTQQEIMVDQYLGPIDQVVTAESLKVKTTLAEATLNNLSIAMGLGEVSGSSANLTTAADKTYTLYINVKGAQGKKRKYTFWKTKINGKTTQTYKRDGETVADIEFTVLVDTSKADTERFGKVEDIA
ncbi:hypothetical protein AAIR98_001607 [Elusimicrobium simillimum]|uniref:hypothetical protein n=1 Tax=Elusimicrobium simillimum TaxID=3143438 RepID=UPI003C6F00D1